MLFYERIFNKRQKASQNCVVVKEGWPFYEEVVSAVFSLIVSQNCVVVEEGWPL
jgi:hypothetical protein